MYMKYELNIKIFLYYHGFTFVKEDDLDYDKAFDAFISYSHTDDEFVIKDIVSGKKKIFDFQNVLYLAVTLFMVI